jgi:hypothetical protein
MLLIKGGGYLAITSNIQRMLFCRCMQLRTFFPKKTFIPKNQKSKGLHTITKSNIWGQYLVKKNFVKNGGKDGHLTCLGTSDAICMHPHYPLNHHGIATSPVLFSKL